MRLTSLSTRSLASACAIAAISVTGLPLVAAAQGLPGITLFGGVPSDKQLNYRLDFGGTPGAWDRYRFRIPKSKMKLAVAQFVIDYPNYFDGQFDTKRTELYVNDKKVPLQDVKWDKENDVIELYPAEPVPAGSNVELMFSNVKNPSRFGMYYFNCRVQTPGDVPLLRDIGSWIVEFSPT